MAVRNTRTVATVVVFVDGRLQPGAHRADRPRPDVAAQTGRGARSGFDVTITVTERTRADVCVSALNVGPGDHALLGCMRNVTPQSAPAPKPTKTTTPPSLAMSYPSGAFGPTGGSTVSPKVTDAAGPVNFTVTGATLPTGVSFDPNTGVFTGLATWPKKMVTASNGSAYSCGVDTRGGAWCWGSNMSGQLGDGTNNNSIVPRDVFGTTPAPGFPAAVTVKATNGARTATATVTLTAP